MLAERPSVRISATGSFPATTHLQDAASLGRTKHLKEKARVSGLVRQKRQAAKLSRRPTSRAAGALTRVEDAAQRGPGVRHGSTLRNVKLLGQPRTRAAPDSRVDTAAQTHLPAPRYPRMRA